MTGRGETGRSKPGRYNDQAYVEAWQSGRRYPTIHNAIFDAAAELLPAPAKAGRVLDLGCSTGLLGRRLCDHLGYDVAWTDGDEDALQRGLEAGVIESDHYLRCVLTPESIEAFQGFLVDQGVRTVVARRVLCVYSDRTSPDMLRELFAAAGVERILLEGQRRDRRAVHPFGSADQQVAGMAPTFALRASRSIDVRFLSRV